MTSTRKALADFLSRTDSVAVVSGAGVSTASGIPDYRDRNGDWKHARPVQFADFIACADTRRRYWARSFSGWSRVAAAKPNAAHYALADLESTGKVDTVITQNVDGLHRRAGSRKVIDLHGRLAHVRCLSCDEVRPRDDWQQQLAHANRRWQRRVAFYAPDGDAELGIDDYARFEVPECRNCGGVIKPDVVFFGETVPKSRVAAAFDAVERAEAMLVIGSSLMVFSGYRFARHANELGKPIVILNRGRTRADDLATLKLDADCEQVLGGMTSADVG